MTVVPWYGFTHGYSAAAWAWFAVLLYANGLAITTGYHRLWSHKTFDAHWSVRLVLMLFGSMALLADGFHHLDAGDRVVRALHTPIVFERDGHVRHPERVDMRLLLGREGEAVDRPPLLAREAGEAAPAAADLQDTIAGFSSRTVEDRL